MSQFSIFWILGQRFLGFYPGSRGKNPLDTCGKCAGTVIKAITSCAIMDIICIAFKSGICIGCKCKIFAALALPWIDPFCDGLGAILG